MKTNPTKDRFKPGSLRGPRTARTVLLRMAVDEARAERIAQLKDDRPDLTWRRIADAVGVSERAAFEWKKTGGIDYENAKALAGVFEVDVDYVWRGPQTQDAPDLLETVARAEQLDDVVDRFSQRVDDVEARLGTIESMLNDIHQALGLKQLDETDAPGKVVETVRDAAARAGAVEPAPEAPKQPRRRAGR